jgi:hypothetical protein
MHTDKGYKYNALAPRLRTDQLARLAVYQRDQIIDNVLETPQFTLWNLLSDSGGTMGLYAGMSLLTVLEVAEIVFLLNAFAIKYLSRWIKTFLWRTKFSPSSVTSRCDSSASGSVTTANSIDFDIVKLKKEHIV